MLPLDYALRNLWRTPMRCWQLIFGSALVVVLVCAAQSFQQGMDRGLAASGDEKNVILLGAGSEESIERSEVALSTVDIVAGSISGLAEVASYPAVSGEVVYNTLVDIPEHGQKMAIFRGVTPEALLVHQDVRLIEGHWPGADEVLLGRRAHHVLGVAADTLKLGDVITFEQRAYRISGFFIADGSVLESEIWLDRADLMAATGREGLSCVVVRLDSAELSDVELFAVQRLDLELVAIGEAEYYRRLAGFFGPIKAMAWITAVLVALGAVFGGLNTLYAAFAARIAEIGTLQAIGFRRWMIALSLLQESCIATLCGTALALMAAVVFLDGIQFAFSAGVFALTISPSTLVLGLVTGLCLGALGCVPPALRCLTPPVPATLRGL